VALTKAVGPEEVARLAIRVARSHLDDADGIVDAHDIEHHERSAA
jgi:hypothetical protein